MKEEVLRDWRGKIIGYIQSDERGNKVLRDFYRKILGRYDKATNMTKDFYNRKIATGDQLLILLRRDEN